MRSPAQWLFEFSTILIAVLLAECVIEYAKARGAFRGAGGYAGQ